MSLPSSLPGRTSTSQENTTVLTRSQSNRRPPTHRLTSHPQWPPAIPTTLRGIAAPMRRVCSPGTTRTTTGRSTPTSHSRSVPAPRRHLRGLPLRASPHRRSGLNFDRRWCDTVGVRPHERVCLSSGDPVFRAAAELWLQLLHLFPWSARSSMCFCPPGTRLGRRERPMLSPWMRASWMSWTVRSIL